jgi:hypothetical protein
MKKIIYVAFAFFALASCQKKEVVKLEDKPSVYAQFGDSISPNGAISKEELLMKYKSLKAKDTINVKVASTIQEVCQKKGCWMNLDLGENQSAFVKFKDYGFFVPKNGAKSEVIVNGKAFVSIESIEELKHYAKDAGKSKAAIDSIVAPETTYSFMADGVLIKK